jgi:alpha-tubulin suppressor-like RCC1 family protein
MSIAHNYNQMEYKQENVIACGGSFTAVVTQEGKVRVWGKEIVVPADAENVVAISSGYRHIAALTMEGRVICWGDNSDGKCEVPRELVNAVSISCGFDHTAALSADGRVHCWGCDQNGQCIIPHALRFVTSIGSVDRGEISGMLGIEREQPMRCTDQSWESDRGSLR